MAVEVVNPLTRLRAELGLSRAELARRLGVDYQVLSRAEAGYTADLPPAVLDALAAAGVDAAAAREEYRSWRGSLRRPLGVAP